MYDHGYGKDTEIVKWFWELLENEFNDEDTHYRKLLQFVTGCNSVPIEGFKGLKGNGRTKCKFKIVPSKM